MSLLKKEGNISESSSTSVHSDNHFSKLNAAEAGKFFNFNEELKQIEDEAEMCKKIVHSRRNF